MRKSAIVLIGLVLVLGSLTSASAGSRDRRVALANSKPAYASIGALVRHADPRSEVDLSVYLGFADRAELSALLAEVSDPADADYGHYLTPDQFHQRYSRPQSDVDAVTSWLRSVGLSVGTVPANHLWVPASGTVSQVEAAFGIRLNLYRVDGHLLRAPATAPRVPSSIAGTVRGVLGLDQERVVPRAETAPPPPAFVNAPPCSAFWGQKIADRKPEAYGEHQPWVPCGYTPDQLRGAYGVTDAIATGNDGTGVTVGIIDAFAAPTIQEDLDTYSARHGLPQLTITQITRPVEHGSANIQRGWYGEETLDVEAVHSLAPGADIVYEGAAGPYGFYMDEAMLDIVDNGLAQIISNSYGSGKGETPTEANIESRNDLFTQAGVEGIGVYFSSGDAGDNVAALRMRSVEWPASSPYVTAVGGTSLGVGEANDYLFETGWGTTNSTLIHHTWKPRPPGDFFYGGGGGTSRIFDEPSYQVGVVPDELSAYWGSENRVVPDIATVGDPSTGMLVGETQTFPDGTRRYGEYRIGGTSLSSPILAGIMALADQRAGLPHGFANPAFYALAGTGALHDIVDPTQTVAVVRANYNNGVDDTDGITYFLRTMNQTGTLHTLPGYDDVTGVGTPNGEAFLDALS